MTTENSNSSSRNNFEAIELQLNKLSFQLEKQSLAAELKQPEKKNWWTTAIEVLGLPALVIAILVQVGEATSNLGVPEKTQAEIEKTKTEELKARAELTQLLESIAEKKSKGISAYREEIERTLPQLETTLDRLNKIDANQNRWFLQEALAKYLLLWVVLFGVNLFFDLIIQVWSTILNTISNSIYALSWTNQSSEQFRIRIQRLHRIMPWFHSILGPIPNLCNWAVRVSIFIALVIPFFNELAMHLGSKENFESIFSHLRHLDIVGTITLLKNMLFSSGV